MIFCCLKILPTDVSSLLEFASSIQWIFLKSFATWANICLYITHWRRVLELSLRNPLSYTSSWDWFSSLQLSLVANPNEDLNPDIDTISVGMYSDVSQHKFYVTYNIEQKAIYLMSACMICFPVLSRQGKCRVLFWKVKDIINEVPKHSLRHTVAVRPPGYKKASQCYNDRDSGWYGWRNTVTER